MKRRCLWLLCLVVVLALAWAVGAVAEGSNPQPVFDDDEAETTMLIGPGWNEDGIPYVGSGLIRIIVLNDSELEEAYGDDYNWTVVKTSQDTLSYRYDAGFDWIHLYVNDIPDTPVDSEYDVTYTCGEASATRHVVFHIVSKALPTSWSIQPVYEWQAGQTYTLDGYFIPEDGDYGGELIGLNDYGFFDEYADDFEVTRTSNSCYEVTPLTPGVYSGTFSQAVGSVSAGRHVLFRVADENGVVPGVSEIKLTSYGSRIPIWDGAKPYGDGFTPMNMSGSVYIQNYDLLVAEYGDTSEWSFEQLGGDDVGVSMYVPDEEKDWASVSCQKLPDEADQVQVKVTVEWGELSAETVLTFDFIEVEPPTGVSIPEVIDLQMGETQTLTGTFLPENWTMSGEEDSEYSMYLDEEEFNVEDELTFTEVDDNIYSITGNTPGTYVGEVRLGKGHMRYEGKLTVLVRDENGEVPQAKPKFRYELEDEKVVIAPLDYSEPVYHDGYLFDQEIVPEIFENLVELYGVPSWSLKQVSGEYPIGTQIRVDDDGSRMQARVTSMPEGACTAVFEITCTMGSQTVTQDVPVEFLEEELPEGSTMPETITVKAGESVDIEATFITDNDFWDDPWFYTPNSVDGEIFKIERINDTKLRFIGVNPGLTVQRFSVNQKNVYVSRAIEIRVTDENGEVPLEGEIKLSVSGRQIPVWEGCGEDDSGFESSGFIGEADIENYITLKAQLGGTAKWSFEQVSGPALPITLYVPGGDNSWVDLNVEQVIEEACTIGVKVRVEWGDLSAEETFETRFVEVVPPTGVTVPEVIDLQLGETQTFTGAFIPADWSMPDEADRSAWMYFDEDNFDLNGELTFVEQNDDTWSITGNVPGTYNVTVQITKGSMTYFNHVTVLVRDENGEVPDPKLAFAAYSDEDATFIMAPLDNSQPIWHDDHIFSMDLERLSYGQLSAKYGKPIWTLEQVSGPAIEAGNWTNDDGDEFYVTLEALPEEPCDATFRVTCSLGGQAIARNVPVSFVEKDLPTGSTIPEKITLKVGESLDVEGIFTADNDDWSDPWFYCMSYNEGDIVKHARVSDTVLRFTGVQAGTTELMLTVYQNNVYASRLVEIVVTGEGGEEEYSVLKLPDGLKAIERQAFAGTAAEIVVVPEGCEAIGALAFADCPNLKEVNIPASVQDIDDDAFGGATGFSIVTTPGSAADAFARDKGIEVIYE